MDDCGRMSISVLYEDQVVTFSFTIPAKLNSKCSSQLLPADLERELVKHPTVLLALPEFLASTEVFFSADSIKISTNTDATKLTPPVVAIDECQVLDEVYGWGGFRSSYGNNTWT